MQKLLLLGSSNIRRWDINLGNSIVTNLGISGLQTSQLLEQNYLQNLQYQLEYNYDYIIINCGGNDIRYFINLDQIVENLITFLTILQNMLQNNNNNTKIIFIPISVAIKNLIKNAKYVNLHIKQKINKNLYLKQKIKFTKYLTNPKFFNSDLIHFNSLGYLKLTQFIINKIYY